MKTIGIIGAGTMGSGIAYVAATSGCTALLHDVSDEQLRRAIEQLRNLFTKAVEKNLLSQQTADDSLRRIRTTANLNELSPSDIIIEAAIEDISIKKNIFRQVEDTCGRKAILASNTSSFSITEIASATKSPERVAGMHFFNPPHVMKLVEIVKGHLTSESTIAHLVDLAKTFGKVPVLVRDTPGFIVNRVARHFYLEALRIFSEGVSTVEEIDRIVRLEGGFRMGPFELMDVIGIDVNYAVTQSVYEQFFHEPRFRPHPIQRQMVQSGLLGRKTGKGFYEYPQ